VGCSPGDSVISWQGVRMSVNAGRFRADLADPDDDIVVFMIGMRINKPLRARRWFPILLAMPRMLRHLDAHPDSGLLGWRAALSPGRALEPMIVQYWRSLADLERFARDTDDPHLETWRRFNREVGASGDVGIWHETYVVKRSAIDTIYVNMPDYGLGAATGALPARSARRDS
jgi:hypothetical protein